MDHAPDLVQLLSALTSSNNEERSAAEQNLNTNWIAQRPQWLLVGLAEQVGSAKEVALRSFAAVLLRRIIFKEASEQGNGENRTIWERLDVNHQQHVKTMLLQAFGSEQILSARHKLSDLIAEISQEGDWPELRHAIPQCTQAPDAGFRESAYRVLGSNPELLDNDTAESLKAIFLLGLQDSDQIVRIAAVQAFTTYLISTNADLRSRLEDLIPALMNVLPPLLQAEDSDSLTYALNALSELVESFPKMFKIMFADLVNFCIAAVRTKSMDNAARQASLEVLVLFAEHAPGMCRNDKNFANDIVLECLSLMTDLGDDEDIAEWLSTDDLDSDESDANHVAGEQALDRLSRKLGGKTILSPCFQWLPKLMSSTKWQERHAALMALSSIAEGCEKIMRKELDKVLAMVLPHLSDVNPRVRWAACNAIGQMCTDFVGDVQEKYTQRVLNALTPVLDATEARVAAHSAAAFVNFCEHAEQASLEPYLDPVLERLLNLLRRPEKYLQEQAVTTIATVADAAEQKFIKYYDTIMPLLLNVLREASGDDFKLLRGKAMECATLVGLAVGKETFGPLSLELIHTLGSIQNTVTGSDDPQSAYLLASWGRICKVLGKDFVPYLGAVMPPLLAAAKLKPDFTVVHDEVEKEAFSEDDGWEFFPVRGQQVGIKTSTLEEKSAATSILVLYAQEMKEDFHAYAGEVLKEIAIPGLLFYYHDGVRTASTQLLPELLNCIKLSSGEDNGPLSGAWAAVVTKLLDLLKSEPSMEMLGDVYQAFYECVEVIGTDSLGPSHLEALVTSTESQLNDYLRRAKARAADHKAGDVDLEQDEDVLEEMEMDEELLSQMSKTFHVLFKVYRFQFVPYWKRLLPLLQQFSESSEATRRQWSICVYDDLIEFCGPDAWQMKDHFIRPLASGLTDASPEVRQAAAYGIGCAAQHGGNEFSDIVAQSLPTLFAVVEEAESRMEENVYATENACVSIAKICRFNSVKVQNLDMVIAAWLKTMPVTHDEQDAPYAYRYLGELLDCDHPAVLSELPFTIDLIAQAVESAVITGNNLSTLMMATKNFLARLPPDVPGQLLNSLLEPRKAALAKQFM
ncbi:Importin subunit beta-3 [Taphrina deformans PYCC 5710]|uniref:Importin subunit beta-3 n=1 Tax=Taphrina deformans (strain PYCC 5710 / ATCC 11124 / CBS 356.35 / IMI 108563 / JCM 9778 / NBRC 8474) TaxID=1097556 RepID=R4X931_TAPDE|nr:Importin subunit beta-3 [Taphrina deformans PYCC 5710]|eukprot:CCG80667.1 Importin subunit beta-3 [Taphrina deformans PYCC 5710]